MAENTQIKSRAEFLGDLVRKMSNEIDGLDFSVGGQMITLLEAIASAAFQNQLSAYKVLELIDVRNLTGQKLQQRAESLKLPDGVGGFGAKPALKARGQVTVASSFTKQTTKASTIFSAPFAGTTTIRVNDASQWPATGSLYIGRNTATSFEGPIAYTSVVNNQSYYTITLSGSLTKDHQFTDEITLAQGGDRLVPAKTQITNTSNIPVIFSTDADLLIRDGESSGIIGVTAIEAGSDSNLASNSLDVFTSSPFTDATVTNVLAISNGTDIESDSDLQQRIIDYSDTLSRGTVAAIRSALLGISDQSSGQSISSLSIQQPTEVGGVTKIFASNALTLEPSFLNYKYELLLAKANGQEQQFKTADAPITPAILTTAKEAPYALLDNQTISFTVDGVTETLAIRAENYAAVTAANAYEVVRDLNAQSNLVEFRTIDSGKKVVCFDKTQGEQLQISTGDAQTALGFPVNASRPLFVYKNSILQSFKGKTASLSSRPFTLWNKNAVYSTNTAIVDGITVNFSITALDFSQIGTTQSAANVNQWVQVLNTKIPGVTFKTSGNTVTVTSNKGANTLSSLNLSGDWLTGANSIFEPTIGSSAISSGFAKDFDLNRFTGEFKFVNKLLPNDIVELAATRTRPYISSNTQISGLFDFTTLPVIVAGPQMIVAFDGASSVKSVIAGISSTVTVASVGQFVRLTANSVTLFANVDVGDWVWINRDISAATPFPLATAGLYRIKRKDVANTWVEFIASGSPTVGQKQAWIAVDASVISVSEDSIQAFACESTPQVVSFQNASAITADSLVTSINFQVFSGSAEKITPNIVSIRSNRYENGSVAILALTGGAKSNFEKNVVGGIQFHVGHTETSVLNSVAPYITESIDKNTVGYGNLYHSFARLNSEILATSVVSSAINPVIEEEFNKLGSNQHLFLTGNLSGFTGRVYNNQATFPYTGFMRGVSTTKNPLLVNSSNSAGTEIGNNWGLRLSDLNLTSSDRAVYEIDKDSVTKTVSVPMSKTVTISTFSPIIASNFYQQVTCTLADPDNASLPLFAPSSVYRDFDFSDFSVRSKSIALYRAALTGPSQNAGIILRSTRFGNANKIHMNVVLPELANSSSETVTHINTSRKDLLSNQYAETHVLVSLKSGPIIAGSSINTGTYSSTVTNNPVTQVASVVLNSQQPAVSAKTFPYKTKTFEANPSYVGVAGNGIIVRISSVGTGAATYSESSGIASINLKTATLNAATLNALLISSGSTLLGTVTETSASFIAADNTDTSWVSTGPGTGYNQLVLANGVNAGNGALGTGALYVAGNVLKVSGSSTLIPAGSYLITASGAGSVTIAVPFYSGLTSQASISAANSPVQSFPVIASTVGSIHSALQTYFAINLIAASTPVSSASVVILPSYMSNPYQSPSIQSASSSFDALLNHSALGTAGGQGSIAVYDKLLNTTVIQVVENTMFPSSSSLDSIALGYSPAGEEIQLIPSNTKTMSAWMKFSAASSLSVLSTVEVVSNEAAIQISSKISGSEGSIEAKSVFANNAEIPVLSGVSESQSALSTKVLNSYAQFLSTGSLAVIKNKKKSLILPPYRNLPIGSSITLSNPIEINNWFRRNQVVRYIQAGSQTGRFVFLRKDVATAEPMTAGTAISINASGLPLGFLRLSVTAGTGTFAARVGDLCQISQSLVGAASGSEILSNLAGAPATTSYLASTKQNVYPGYTVVAVESSTSIIISAPDYSGPSSVTTTAATDVTFVKMLITEKNVRTNRQPGTAYWATSTQQPLSVAVKKFGDFLSLSFIYNNSLPSSLNLDKYQVSTDDFVTLGSFFDSANQGTFRVVSHNNNNTIVLYAPDAGKDQVISSEMNSGIEGSVTWGVGPISPIINPRPIRFYDADNVRLGDFFNIASAVDNAAPFFPVSLTGSYQITEIGLYKPAGQPVSDFSQYIEVFMPNNAPTGTFDIPLGQNFQSITFTENELYEGVRMINGSAQSTDDISLADLYYSPVKSKDKVSVSYGTVFAPIGKIDANTSINTGIDAYSVFDGVIHEANKILTGDSNNLTQYPGVAASGTRQEILPNIVRVVSFDLGVQSTSGIIVDQISDAIKSAVQGYVNSLGVGRSVVLSEIISAVQSTPGVFAVQINSALPAAVNGVILVSENEVARIVDFITGITVQAIN